MEKILILSCSTGEGHNSAARAIHGLLEEKGIYSEITDPVAFQSKRMEHLVSALYNDTIRKHPQAFGAVYKLGDLYANSRLPSPVYWANAHYSGALKQYIEENDFTAVVCTHLYGMEAMTALRKHDDFKVPAYGVLTDYTSIPFLSETRLDGFFAPTEDIRQQLIEKGMDENTVYVSGIPVSRNFMQKPSREEARKQLEICPDQKVFLVMTGGVGCENMEGLCEKLLQNLPEKGLVLVLTGNNEKLRSRLDEKYGNLGTLRTVSFTRQVPLYMAAADVLLSKPGGLSTTEAAVANIPIVHIHAIPGCETCNARYFSQHGMSLWAQSDQEAVIYASGLACQEDAAERMRQQQRRLIPEDATGFIVKKVVGL